MTIESAFKPKKAMPIKKSAKKMVLKKKFALDPKKGLANMKSKDLV